MAQMNLNIPLLREGKGKEFVSYLDGLRQHQSDFAICQSLFEAVDNEYLLPSIFSVFLSWTKSPEAIVSCIRHGPTRCIRREGIKQFGKTLADPGRWEAVWRAVEGTAGLVSLFGKISVAEVKMFTRAIGRCNRGQRKPKAREKAVEELLRALLPSHYSDSKIHSHEKRPIQELYAQMVSACSPKFVDQLLDAEDASNFLYRGVPAKRLIKTHGERLQNRVFEGLFGGGGEKDHLHQWLESFTYIQSLGPGPIPKVTGSMAFTMKVLRSRLGDIDNNQRWPNSISEANLLFSLLQRSIKKKLPDAQLHDVIMLGLQLLKAKPKLKPAFKSNNFWSTLITRWLRSPKIYEDSLVLALQLGLGGSTKTISRDFFQTVRDIQMIRNTQVVSDLTWPLLRLFCLHIPQKGIDIDTADDFTLLAEQRWSTDDFKYLSKDHSVRLLNSLYNANPNYSFLQGPGGSSILSMQDNISQRNFNVVLLLAMIQHNSEDMQRKTNSAVDGLRKKAATAREQPDRAQFAKAACNYAIASGNLDLYAETIIWQQRYIRDPLTVKVVFGRDAVTTKEGIDLLSGIPQPLPQEITLTEIALRVKRANEILTTFHESMRIAKREPSFYEPDWAGVKSLFQSVIGQRVTRAEDLQKSLQDSKSEVYAAIWVGTLDMLQKVDVEFLNQAYPQILRLLDTLPPKVLATTANALLEVGDESRSRQDRQSGDSVLERLSYEVLLRLTKSDKPELARQLVLRTILNRPDASSWHRQMLSVSFMKSLTAKDAHEMLLAFATAIGEKLEEQSYVKIGETQPHLSAPSQSLVKVTTVKYLAQLLDSAEFISGEAAVEVLVELFKAGTHRDIRLATLESLSSLLNSLCNGENENWRSNALVEKILAAFETIIPVVGSSNERRPPRQEDWDEARKTGILPDISDISAGLPPLLDAMITTPQDSRYLGLKNLQGEWVARYLLPVLKHSQVEHRKWITLFLAKHKAHFTIDDLPPTPISPLLWETLVIKYPKLIPETVLEDFNKYVVMTIAPPMALKDFNNLLSKNADLRNTPEVQHWLSVFGQSMNHYSGSGTQILLSMIHHDLPHSSVSSGITFGKIEYMVIGHASLFLYDYEKYTNIWNAFVDHLRPPTKLTCPNKDAESIRSMVSTWQKSGRLVLEKVMALVINKKKEYTRARKRSIFPSTTRLGLWLLPYPCFPTTAEIDRQCQIFVHGLEGLFSFVLEGEANVLRWPRVAEDALAVSKLLNTDGERLCVAYYTGTLVSSACNQKSLAINFVKIELVLQLVSDGQGGLKGSSNDKLEKRKGNVILRTQLKEMIERWESDDDESVREMVAEWIRERKGLWERLTGGE